MGHVFSSSYLSGMEDSNPNFTSTAVNQSQCSYYQHHLVQVYTVYLRKLELQVKYVVSQLCQDSWVAGQSDLSWLSLGTSRSQLVLVSIVLHLCVHRLLEVKIKQTMKSDVLSLPLQAPIGITHTQIYLCTCILLNMLLVIMLTMFAQYIVIVLSS